MLSTPQLRADRPNGLSHERFGIDSWTTHEHNVEALGAVIAAYRWQASVRRRHRF